MIEKKKKFLCYLVVIFISPYPAYIIFQILENLLSNEFNMKIDWSIVRAYEALEIQVVKGISFLICLFICYMLSMSFVSAENFGQKTKMIKITNKIAIPPVFGNGEYGTARFATYDEFKTIEGICVYRHGFDDEPKGGVVIGRKQSKHKDKEEILYVTDDRHMILLGATRSGKDRRILFLSVWLNIISGLNILVFDPKGEAYAYTSEFAKQNEYQILVLDFRNPECGMHYNYLQPILDAVKEQDIALAIDATWDLVSLLVGEQKGEAIWYNGECATIAATILIVVLDAPEEYRNMTNVYYFLAMMVETDSKGQMFFEKYLSSKPDTHPAKAVFAMAKVAHTKTRGSFFSSALGTLKHFTNPKIAEMTSFTDISFEELAKKKSIVYLIVPDEKKTLYPLAVLYMTQMYMSLTQIAIANGNRVPIDWYIFANEFGNYPRIPSFDSYITVGAGRGIRFVIVVQDYQQIESLYKDTYETIKGNCQGLIFLKSASDKVNEAISKRLGNYTIHINSSSNNHNIKQMNNGNVGKSTQMTGRRLLMPDEVNKIGKPYILVKIEGENPIILYAPDLSKYKANKELGLGNEKHNRELLKRMLSNREKRDIKPIKLWGIWNDYNSTYDKFDVDDKKNTKFF